MKMTSLNQFLEKRGVASEDLREILRFIVQAGKQVQREISRFGLLENMRGLTGAQNVHGDQVKKFDLRANQIFIEALRDCPLVAGVVSEEENDCLLFNPESGRYLFLMDPVDGSSNIETLIPIGTIFSLLKIPENRAAHKQDFLQKGTQQHMAGYFIYGSSTMLVFTVGQGAQGFTFLQEEQAFFHSHSDMKMPEKGRIFHVNETNYLYFPAGVKDYLNYCKNPESSERHPYTGRSSGAFVVDFHRCLQQGGIFFYTANLKEPRGKLRLMYECNPLSLIAEQAGALASTGQHRILETEPEDIHQRSPVIIGSKMMVEEMLGFL